MVFIFLNSFDLLEFHVNDFNTRNKVLTAKLLRQGYRYHKLRKAFGVHVCLPFRTSVNMANVSDTEASFLDSHLSISAVL